MKSDNILHKLGFVDSLLQTNVRHWPGAISYLLENKAAMIWSERPQLCPLGTKINT